jgi:flagellar hook-length control protein FliK
MHADEATSMAATRGAQRAEAQFEREVEHARRHGRERVPRTGREAPAEGEAVAPSTTDTLITLSNAAWITSSTTVAAQHLPVASNAAIANASNAGTSVVNVKLRTSIAEPTAANAAELDAQLAASLTSAPREPGSTASTTNDDAAPRLAHVGEAKLTAKTAHELFAPPAPLARAEQLAEQRAADILRQVRVALQPTERQATIQLDPPELGRIAIRIAVRKGRVDAELRVEDRATLDVLARHVPELRATLERSGLHAGTFDLQLGFGERRGETTPRRAPRTTNDIHIAAPRELRTALASNLGRDSAVDTYA